MLRRSNINQIGEPISGQVLATGGGSLALKPEKSKSYTIGVVLQPSFFPRFTASIDYYNIKIKDAISAPTPGDVIAACFGTASSTRLANRSRARCLQRVAAVWR